MQAVANSEEGMTKHQPVSVLVIKETKECNKSHLKAKYNKQSSNNCFYLIDFQTNKKLPFAIQFGTF